MRAHDLAANVEADPKATDLVFGDVTGTMEALEQVRAVLLWYADPAILHAEQRIVTCPFKQYLDCPAIRRILDRVAKQVRDNLLDPFGFTNQLELFRR